MAAIHERLRFDTAQGEVLDGDRRYVLLRADVLMGLFARLPEAERVRALGAFGASAFEHGGASVRAYARTVPGDASALFRTVGEGAASLGWGAWRYELGASTGRLHVHNSPFARFSPASTTPCCAPIAGIFRAVCEQTWGHAVTVEELQCAAVRIEARDDVHECVFEARKAQQESR